MNQFKHAKWWRSYLDKLWKSFWKLKFMKNKVWSSIALCQIRSKYARKEHWREENRVKKIENSRCSLLAHFWSTSRSPFCSCYKHFKSQEVNNPMLQTVCNLELKRRSYGQLKATTQSWKGISHWHFLMRKFLHWHSLMQKFSHWLFPMRKFSHCLSPMQKISHHLSLMWKCNI